jgi:DNA-binding NarL/FixJ family response regulator
MDIEMPVLNGIEATKQITREIPGTKVIMLTMHEEGTHDLQAYSAAVGGNMPGR